MQSTVAQQARGSSPAYRYGVYGAALLLVLVMAVEAINIAFYDP